MLAHHHSARGARAPANRAKQVVPGSADQVRHEQGAEPLLGAVGERFGDPSGVERGLVASHSEPDDVHEPQRAGRRRGRIRAGLRGGRSLRRTASPSRRRGRSLAWPRSPRTMIGGVPGPSRTRTGMYADSRILLARCLNR